MCKYCDVELYTRSYKYDSCGGLERNSLSSINSDLVLGRKFCPVCGKINKDMGLITIKQFISNNAEIIKDAGLDEKQIIELLANSYKENLSNDLLQNCGIEYIDNRPDIEEFRCVCGQEIYTNSDINTYGISVFNIIDNLKKEKHKFCMSCGRRFYD